MSLFRCVVLGAGLWLSLIDAEAEVLLSDAFTYADGPLITVSNGKWSNHSGTVGQMQVTEGRVVLVASPSGGEDVNAPLAGQPFPAGTPLSLYLGLTVRFTRLPGVSGDYFCHFKDPSFGFRPKLFASTEGASPGKFRLGISNANNTPAAILGLDLALHTEYRLVVRYSMENATGTLWVDPVTEGDPSVTADDPASAIQVEALALRQSSGIGDLEIHALVVGTQFTDVVSQTTAQAPLIVTQPQSQSVTVGFDARFSVVALGDAPLSYQWQFNGSNLAGANQSSLVLTNVQFPQAGNYGVTLTNAWGITNSQLATLTVSAAGAPSFSLLNYNAHGNHVEDWSTNSAQVRAIGRQVQHLDPDLITFQEIPLTNTWQMANFVAAFRPGFHLATNSGTDGYIRSVIVSRFPITRSQKWLDGVSLAEFGYEGTFTRDLFEAQVAVPGFPEPLHVFTVHLKAGQGADDAARRAAEAGALSNYFATGFLTTNAARPYVLTGDMNEDMARPPASQPQTLERLTSEPTGLRLTTPRNPLNGSELTISIQTGMYARYDYILPGGLLFSNIVSSEIFRSDLLPSPSAPLLPTDSATASDHLPVMMVFSNPFNRPFRLLSVSAAAGGVTLTWESQPGRLYDLETTRNMNQWSVTVSNLAAPGTNMAYTLPAAEETQLYRVRQHP